MEAIADELVSRLEMNAEHPQCHEKLTNEDIRVITYVLIVHRSRRGGVLGEGHLRLLAHALGIKRESVRGAEYLGLLPVKRKNVTRFYSPSLISSTFPGVSEV
jgi:hypothetical protein